jgi:predicted AAA+ superfamily ATPase
MIKRSITNDIKGTLRDFPVVGILGARQVGKTTLAKMMKETGLKNALYLDLEKTSDLQKLSDPQLYLEKYSDRLVIIDEIQRKPELFPLIRSLVDSKTRNGRFLILGSASPDLSRQSSESLAGRICYHQLTGFLLSEVCGAKTQKTFEKLWLRGGFPRSFLAKSDETSFTWRENFIRTHLERDIPGLGISIPASMLLRFWQMLSHCHGQLWNASKIANSLGISPPSARKYLDILQDTFMVRQLQPYYTNVKKRLVKSPKVYIRDSGLLHYLLGIGELDSLIGHPSAGASWEGWLIEQIMALIPKHWTVNFYRTAAGAEIDLVLLPTQLKPPIAVEFKYSLAPKPTKSFWNAFEDLKPQKAYVIYPGDESYPLAENVSTLPVSQLHNIVA